MRTKRFVVSFLIAIILSLLGFAFLNNKVLAYSSIEEVAVSYAIKINKIDSDTSELLSGAKFNLLDKAGNVLRTATTGEDGTLDFGLITTYGEGTDTYLIQEIQTPDKYYIEYGKKLRVKVEKTVLDVENGFYSLNVICDATDYTVDTSRYEFTPIKTEEQLKKVGSGETVTVDGVAYKFEVDSNYKLMNDITLTENWEPINKEIKCIFDGNGYTIKGLKIEANKSLDYSEVGLFRVFTGIIQNLNLEGVTIDIKDFKDNAENISGYTGTGAFAGVMNEGYIINCKVTSGIVTAASDNIGGFIGHTSKNGMVIILDSENNATVASASYGNNVLSSNVGGIIGCALGSIVVTNTTNNGSIYSNNFNAGGLVGFSNASDYQDLDMDGTHNEGNNIIELIIENKSEIGKYSINLENLDIDTLELIKGAVYTVYDETKTPIEGLEKITLEEGKANLIIDREILKPGHEYFYLEEVQPVKGYRAYKSYIKIDVNIIWDKDKKEFVVSAEADSLSEDEFKNDTNDTNDSADLSRTGIIYNNTTFTKSDWNLRRTEFVNCANNGDVTTDNMNAAGIIGTSYGIVDIIDCKNTKTVHAKLKAGGIISELRTIDYTFTPNDTRTEMETENTKEYSVIDNCLNTGEISATIDASETQGKGSAGGIVSHLIGNIKISNTKNKANVTGYGEQSAGGILADGEGKIEIDECENYGTIQAPTTYSWGTSANSIAGGIIAKNRDNELSREYSSTKIKDSKNYGTVQASNHVGGIIALSTGKSLVVDNCVVDNSNMEQSSTTEQKLQLYSQRAGDIGGIVGVSVAESTFISNCTVDKVFMSKSSDSRYSNGSYGTAAGIIGTSLAEDADREVKVLKVSKCNFTNSEIRANGKEAAGVLACQTTTKINNITTEVSGCRVFNDIIFTNMENGNSSSGSASGVIGSISNIAHVKIADCEVEKGNIQKVNGSGYTSASTGLIGILYTNKTNDNQSLEVTGCTVKSSDISYSYKNESNSDSAAGVSSAGIGYVDGNQTQITLKDCSFEQCKITGLTGNIGGAIAAIKSGSVTVDNVNVLECDMQRVVGSTGNQATVGGLIGLAGDVRSLDIKNSKVIGKETDDIEKMNYITANNGNLGGIVGCISLWENNLNNSIENIEVKYMNINSSFSGYNSCSIGGIIGNQYSGRIKEYKNITLDHCNVSGAGVSNVGGIIGNLGGSGMGMFETCNVTNSTIQNDLMYQRGQHSNAAGLVSNLSGNDNTMKDCHIENVTISGYGKVMAGGVGFTNGLDADSCSVKNLTIIDKDENGDSGSTCTYKAMSGFLSVASSSASLTNIDLDTINISSSFGSVGGLYVYTSELGKLENITAKNLTLYNGKSRDASTGAIAGIGAGTGTIKSSINNVTVEDSNITTGGHLLGGLFGHINSAVTMNGCRANNVTMLHENLPIEATYPKDRNAGGLVAYITNNITINGSSVENSSLTVDGTKTNSAVNLGGFIGWVDGHISVNGSKLLSTEVENIGSSALTGGIVGDILYDGGSDKASLAVSGLEINDVSVIGYTHVGGITGLVNKVNLSGIKAEKLTVESRGNSGMIGVGGLVGVQQTSYAGDNTFTATGIDLTEVSVKSPMLAGGIAAYTHSYLKVNEANLDNVKVNSNGYYAGGIVAIADSGFGDNKSVYATNVNIKNNSEVTGVNQVGGIVGYAKSVEIPDATIENSKFTSKSSQVGGFAGVVDGAASVPRATIKDVEISGISFSGGAFGVVNSKLEMPNLTLNKVNVSTKSDSAGGAIGLANSGAEMAELKAEDIEIDTINHAGGIIGLAGGNITMQKPEVKDVTLETKVQCSGGLVGCMVSGSFKSSEIDVKDITIHGVDQSGGLVGYVSSAEIEDSELSNITISSSKINGTYGPFLGGYFGIVESLKISDSSIEDVTISGNSHSGGIAGVSTIDAKDITVDDITINMTQTIPAVADGGVVGVARYGSNLNGLTVNDITLNSKGSLAGGIAGCISGDVTNANVTKVRAELKEGFSDVGGIAGLLANGQLKDSTIDDVTVYGLYESYSCGDIGGAVGAYTSGQTIKNVIVKNSSVTSNKIVGGIVGFTYSAINDCTVDNVTIRSAGSPSNSHAGGIVAFTGQPIDNATVKDSRIYAVNEAGGITAISSGTIKDSLVDNVTIQTTSSTSGGDIGGVVGVSTNLVENVTVKNSNITSPKQAGGIAGTNGTPTLNCNIVDCTVQDTNINATINIGGIVAANYGNISGATIERVVLSEVNNVAGGIVGALEGNLTSSTVDDVNVAVSKLENANGGDAGGAVGATVSGKISGVTVTNSTITSNKLAGGIIGAGSGVTTLEDLTVSDNTVTYGVEEQGTGEYIGAPNMYMPPAGARAMMMFDEEEEEEIEDNIETAQENNTEVVSQENEEVQDATSDPEIPEVVDEEEIEESEEPVDTESQEAIDIESPEVSEDTKVEAGDKPEEADEPKESETENLQEEIVSEQVEEVKETEVEEIKGEDGIEIVE